MVSAYLRVPDEEANWKYGCQAHVRGASVHLDLRLEVDKTTLVGWTLDLIKSILAELILRYSNEEEFMAALKDKSILKGKNWREFLREVIEDPTMKLKDELSKALDDKYKEQIREHTKGMSYEEIAKIIEPYKERVRKFFEDPSNKVLCQTKEPEPHEWLNAQGKVEPGEVGATRNLPGFFVPFDSGTVEFLAQKPYMHEYWLHGKVFNGKFIVRKLARTKKWAKTGRALQVWMMWKTKEDDLPYVLKRRAVQQGWMPPEGKSALPKHIRVQIPKGLEYWKYKGQKAKAVRDELVKLIKKKEVTITPVKEAIEERKVKFQVKRLWWKGPVVIRGTPRIFYVLLFHNGKVHYAWHFTKNPVDVFGEEVEELTTEEFLESYCCGFLEGVMEQALAVPLEPEMYEDGELLKKEGSLPPEHPLNPNKELDLHFDTVDEGTAIIIAEERGRFYRFKMQGKQLKGYFSLMREDPHSKMWKLARSTPPSPSEEALETEFVLHKHYNGVEPHWDIRLKVGDRLLEFNIYRDPLEMGRGDEAKANRKVCKDLTWFIKQGQGIDRKVAGKWTKIDVIDTGKAKILLDTGDEVLFSVDGEKLKGRWLWRRQSGAIRKVSAVAESNYAPVARSDKNLGGVIRPIDVKPAFQKPILLQDNYVFIANPERETKGDIDIIIRAPIAYFDEEENLEKKSKEELLGLLKVCMERFRELDDWYHRALRFRLSRAVKAVKPELYDRLHISHDPRGPFTNYLPLYDLVLVPSQVDKPIQMSREEVERLIQESFKWAKRYDIDHSSEEELWIRGVALFPQCSLNQRCYSREEIKKMARTAIGKPIMVNHGEPPYEGLKIGVIEDAEEENGQLEFIGRITDPEWVKRIKETPKDERWLSIGAQPRDVALKAGKEYPSGLIIEEISILVPPAKPGVPKAHYEVKGEEW